MSAEQWDLTGTISPYLDRHMLFPLLEFVDRLIAEGRVNYSAADVTAARLDLLRPTNMVDYAIDIYKNKKESVPEEWTVQKQNVMAELATLEQKCAPFTKLVAEQAVRRVYCFHSCCIYSHFIIFVQEKLIANGNWNMSSLSQIDAAVTQEVVDSYRQLARFQFDCGDYATSRSMLANYIALFAHPPQQQQQQEESYGGGGGGDDHGTTTDYAEQHASNTSSNNNNNNNVGNKNMYYLRSVDDTTMLNVLWGRLACEILVLDWEAANIALEAVKTALEGMVTAGHITPLVALQQRTWVLHWSLFVYWNSNQSGLEKFVELVLYTDKYKQAVTTNAPHLLRYLTAAVLLCKRRLNNQGSASDIRKLLKHLVYVMQDCEYSDPIVEFVESVTIKFDFDASQTKLAECESVLSADFFLCQQATLFMEEARFFVFENYCRIHNKMEISALGSKLAMKQDAAERWIVDLIIRNPDLSAVIDNDTVVMGNNAPASVYEQVRSATMSHNVRSATLVQNLQTMLNESRKDKAKRERLTREDEY